MKNRSPILLGLAAIMALAACTQENFSGSAVGAAALGVTPPPGAEPTAPPAPTPAAPTPPASMVMTQSFQAPTAQAKADILFVVDTTPTMFVTIANMASRIGSVKSLGSVDFQIGVLNASITSGDSFYTPIGQLMPLNTQPLLVNPTLNILNNQVSDSLNNYIVSDDWVLGQNLSFNGIPYPGGDFCPQQPYCTNGPATPLAAIADMIIKKGASANAGFFRKGATFVPIIVSASDEGAGGLTPAALVSAFQTSLSSTMQGMKAYSIIVQPGDTSCLSTYQGLFVGGPFVNDAMYGQSFSQLSSLTGGSTTSLCAADYSSVLAGIPAGIEPAPLNSVTLNQTPIAGTVKVTFTPSANIAFTVSGETVTFASAVPPGTSVNVSYLVPGT